MRHLNLTKNLLILLGLTMITFAACNKDKKDSDNNTNTNSEVAIAENDKKAYGLYTGTFVGSSGYFELEIRRIGSEITLVFDGVTYDLSSNIEIFPNTDIVYYAFENDSIKINFSVKADGSNPELTIKKAGHTITVITNKVQTIYPIANFVGKYSWLSDPTSHGTAIISCGISSGKIIVKEDDPTDVAEVLTINSMSISDADYTFNVSSSNSGGRGDDMKFVNIGNRQYKYDDGDLIIYLTKVN